MVGVSVVLARCMGPASAETNIRRVADGGGQLPLRAGRCRVANPGTVGAVRRRRQEFHGHDLRAAARQQRLPEPRPPGRRQRLAGPWRVRRSRRRLGLVGAATLDGAHGAGSPRDPRRFPRGCSGSHSRSAAGPSSRRAPWRAGRPVAGPGAWSAPGSGMAWVSAAHCEGRLKPRRKRACVSDSMQPAAGEKGVGSMARSYCVARSWRSARRYRRLIRGLCGETG